MAPMTLRSLERGGSGVTMGAYLAVMQVLGIDKDLDLLGQADPLGRALQDTRLQPLRKPTPARASSSGGQRVPSRMPLSASASAPTEIDTVHQLSHAARDWIGQSGFADAEVLAGLIAPLPAAAKKPR